jgi:hypothetical protein
VETPRANPLATSITCEKEKQSRAEVDETGVA